MSNSATAFDFEYIWYASSVIKCRLADMFIFSHNPYVRTSSEWPTHLKHFRNDIIDVSSKNIRFIFSRHYESQVQYLTLFKFENIHGSFGIYQLHYSTLFYRERITEIVLQLKPALSLACERTWCRRFELESKKTFIFSSAVERRKN
jgi:hypothetical protein